MNQSKVAHFLRSRKKWVLLLFAMLICIAYQADNIPRTDDEYLGEQVYWLLKEGKVKTNLGYSELGYDVYQSIYHKLFIYSGYAFTSVFGWSLFSLHAVSGLCFLFFLALFVWHSRQQQDRQDLHIYFGALLLMLFNQDLLYAIGSFRPEVMVMALGFAAYAFLEKYLRAGNGGLLVLSACCAGLCMFAHLNGIIFIAGGFLLLCLKKKFLAAGVYGFISVLAFSPYFADVFRNADLAYFWTQFNQDPVLNPPDTHWYTLLVSLLNEQIRFLFTEKQVILTATLILVLCFSYRKLKKDNGILLTYTLLLIVGLALVCPSKSTKYMVLYLPLLYLVLVKGWMLIEAEGIRKKILPIRILMVAGLAVSLFYSFRQINSNVENLVSGGLIAEHQALSLKIKGAHKKLTMMAPRIAVFNLVEDFGLLMDIGLVQEVNFDHSLKTHQADYIIFSGRDRDYFHIDQLLHKPGSLLTPIDSTEHYLLAEVKR